MNSPLYDVAVCPFEIVRDSNERHTGFNFTGLRTNWLRPSDPLFAHRDPSSGQPLLVPLDVQPLWPRHLGDYTIQGLEERVQIETKHSLEDLFDSFSTRRGNFEEEIRTINSTCEFGMVVICSSWPALMRGVPMSDMNPTSIMQSITSWRLRYPRVHWTVCPDRGLCELITFNTLAMFWRKTNGNEEGGSGGVRHPEVA